MSGDQALVLERTIKAAPDSVFDAWVVPALMRQWLFASDDGEIIGIDVDPRPGGRYSIMERRADAGDVDHFGAYAVVDRPDRLTFSLDVPKHFAEHTTIDIAIAASSAGTLLRLEQTGIDPDVTRPFWNDMLDRLVALLEADDA